MLRQYNNPTIKAIYDELIKKNNAYIGSAIKKYLDEIFEKINDRVKILQLDDQCADDVSLVFLKSFSEINFTRAYTQKGLIKRNMSHSLDFDLDPLSFKSFVEKQIPAVKSLDEYIAKVLGITDKKCQLISTVTQIKKVINEYSNENKQGYIDSFNKELDQFISSAKEKSYFDLRCDYGNEIAPMIDRLQRKETAYYTGRFFADYRRSNSSLQPKIDKARACFSDFKSDDIDRLQRKAM